MNKTATVVIGANAGDEGKGTMTNFLARPDSLIVRYCSGANAGHTVLHDGKRHIFRHFGSGSLKGAATYLSRFYINNPILWSKELDCLTKLDCHPKLYVDPCGLVTVPVDMMINQIVEESRGQYRHGSCGVGINETVKRSEHAQYRIEVADLDNPKLLADRLHTIMRQWVPTRLQQLAVMPSDEWLDRLESSEISTVFIEYCQRYLKSVQLSTDVMTTASHIIFEGAQGLLLDQDHAWFPHVTHAHTGLLNVAILATETGITELDTVYVSRSYLTRHGAGPLPTEVAGLWYPDETNHPNEWQGSLRFGLLDIDLLVRSITADIASCPLAVRCNMAVTCMDQVTEIDYYDLAVRHTDLATTMAHRIAERIGAQTLWLGYGPDSRFLRRA